MPVINASVLDITSDTLLSESKPKIKSNFDKLLENDIGLASSISGISGGTSSGGTYIKSVNTAVAKARYDNTYKGNFLFLGDSMVRGSDSSYTGTSYVGLINTDLMNKQFGTAKDEYTAFPSFENPAGGTMFGAFTGTWEHVNNSYSSVGEGVVTYPTDTLSGSKIGWCKTLENAATMTVKSYGYNLKLLFASDGVFAEAPGSISYSVDGGAPVVVNLAGSTYYKWVEIETSGSVDVVVTVTTTGGKSVACLLVHHVDKLVGLKIHNIALGGSSSYHWALRTNIIDAYAPVASYVALGGNDMAHGKSATEYKASMRIIIQKLMTYGDVILGFFSPWFLTDTTLLNKIPQYRTAINALALEYGLPIVDTHEIYNTGIEWNANGLFTDMIHCNDAGHYLIYDFFKTKIKINGW